MKTQAVMKMKARSRNVNVPSTNRWAGKPRPATTAPTSAVITIASSGDLNRQLLRTKAATIAASVQLVDSYRLTSRSRLKRGQAPFIEKGPGPYFAYIAFTSSPKSIASSMKVSGAPVFFAMASKRPSSLPSFFTTR